MSRNAPRTGGKAAPKSQSPPRDAASGAERGSEWQEQTQLRSRGHGSGSDAGGNDDASKTDSHWKALRDLLEHKALLKTLMRAAKSAQTNAADAAKEEMNVGKRALLYACSYALYVPAALSDRPVVMNALSTADSGIGWLYDKTHGTVDHLEAEGERVAAESRKHFDATVSGTAHGKAEPVPAAVIAPGNGNGNGNSGGVKHLAMQIVAVMVYLSLTVARGVVYAITNPRAAAEVAKRGTANVFSAEQWKLRCAALSNATRRLWARNKGDAAEPGGSTRLVLMEWIGTVLLVLMPWRPMPQPVQRAQ